MVFFCCDGCGETMKKSKVDAHAAKCRECYAVSCVDCSQSFPGDEYRYHTTCITEAERYEKTIFRGNRKLDESGTGHRASHQQKGKKLTPQEAWNRTIQDAAERAPSPLKSYMDQLAALDNVPRKEKQFRNFAANSLRLWGQSGENIKSEIWAFLAKVREERRSKEEEGRKKQQQPRPQPKEEEGKGKDAPKPKPKSVPVSSSDDGDPKGAAAALNEFPSEKAVTKAVKREVKRAGGSVKFKTLRRRVREALAVRTHDREGEKRWKRLLRRCVEAHPKKFALDGKILTMAE